MSPSDKKPPLIVLIGPTAVGKTALSIRLAKAVDGEIISSDSRYFYRGMDIGTAKPTPEERQDVSHHLIDIADPDETWSLALFQQQAITAINEVTSRDRVPILVGGTGQYVRAITEGWEIPEQEPDHRLRNALLSWTETLGPQALHDRLRILDPLAAENIDFRNIRRTIRALEVIFITGYRFSEQRRKADPLFNIIQVGLSRPREELYKRVDQRIDQMMTDGFLEEVENLLEKYPPDLPAFSAIGYRQFIDYLQGAISLEEAITLIRRQTRIFVRRQSNWFKPDDPEIHWFRIEPGVDDKIKQLVNEFLAT